RRVALRENAHHQLSLEVAVQVRLMNKEHGVVAWEHGFVRCNPEAVAWHNEQRFVSSLHPFETPIRAIAHNRPLSDYKGGASHYVFELELNEAVRDLADDLAARLQQSRLY